LVKKILLWSVYAGVVALLIFGAVIRTEAKVGQVYYQPGLNFESKDSGSLGQGNRENEKSKDNEEGETLNDRGSRGSFSGNGEEELLGAEEENDRISLAGVVVSLEPESLWIAIDQAEDLELTGRAYRFILESEFLISVGNQVEISGLYENGEFKISWIQNLITGQELRIRQDSGKPLWGGGTQ
jgi:hypothetical protein